MILSGRLMGIDCGTQRVGVTLTDEDGAIALQHAAYESDELLVARICALVREKEVGGVVVGKSHDLDGTPNRVQKDIDDFVGMLREKLGVLVVLEPEQFTTQAALRIQGRTAETDASAAALILDAYLVRHKSESHK